MTLTQFKDKYLGKQVEYHSFGAGAYNQCVDLVNAYINQCLDNNTKDYTEIIGTNAKDFGTKYDREDFDLILNTPTGIPQAGDIIYWNGNVGGGAGHVAIVLEATVNTFKSLDQNWSQKERVTLETHSYNNVTGWLRPKQQAQVSVDAKVFEELVRKSTEYDKLLPIWKADKELLTKNEQMNKDKDAEIARLKKIDLTKVKTKLAELQAEINKI